ncbi:hypothetical protein BD410DRAFT_791190 [Rickenella mellea]|uniref:Uncharacterized protein n=1 Tax=Rickenella mellea TaxID=50990 RepID=A0A4Y7PXJ3_9AGAM|nr:hypothetical protein BD410DRAFT_791190 [Rickenella mellea]
MTAEDMGKLSITSIGSLCLKPNLEERLAATTDLGRNDLWSSTDLYRQLSFLESHVRQAGKASGRAWIEAFLFRAPTMLSPEKFSPILRECDELHTFQMYNPSAFVVIQSRADNPSDDIPQAVRRMHECGKLLLKKVVRGALTNGRDWFFLLVKLNDDYDGATYKQSDVIQLQTTRSPDGQPQIHEPWPDLIADSRGC